MLRFVVVGGKIIVIGIYLVMRAVVEQSCSGLGTVAAMFTSICIHIHLWVWIRWMVTGAMILETITSSQSTIWEGKERMKRDVQGFQCAQIPMSEIIISALEPCKGCTLYQTKLGTPEELTCRCRWYADSVLDRAAEHKLCGRDRICTPTGEAGGKRGESCLEVTWYWYCNSNQSQTYERMS